MALRSDRPLDARIFLAFSILFLSATLLPFLYSILFPNEDLQGVASALEGRGSPPLDADAVIEEAKQAAGTLTHSIQIACGAGRAVRYARTGPLSRNTCADRKRPTLRGFRNVLNL